MKLKKLLLLTSIPLLLFASKLKGQNYNIMPDSSYKINFPFPAKRIVEIYNGSYSIKPTNEYSDTNAVKIISAKKNIKKEIITPILNNLCEYRGFNTIRQLLEESFLNSITTNPKVLKNFDVYFSDNNLSIKENYSLCFLLEGKKAIPYFIQEEIPTDNSFPGKKGYVEYPYILFFKLDKTTPIDTTKLIDLIKKDSIKVEKPKTKRLIIKRE